MTPSPRAWSGIVWVPVALSAGAAAFPGAAPAFLAAALFALLALPALAPDFLHRPGLLAPAAVLFLFACGMAVYRQPGGPLDLFEDGQILAAADAYARGGRPYLDTYPIHGWGADGGFDAFLFGIFGATLETFRARRAVMTAAAFAALAAAAGALFRPFAWKAAAFLAALCLCPFVSERQMLAFASLAFLLRGAWSGRRRDFFLAGAVGACELFYSFDLGLVLLSGGLAGAATRPFVASGFRRIGSGVRNAAAFAGGALAASLPFLAFLVRDGSLGAFFRVSFLEIPRTIGDVWGLPAGSARDLLAQGDPRTVLLEIGTGGSQSGVFLLVVVSAAAATALLRAARGKFEGPDGAAWIAIAVAAVAVRGALGRADAGHFALYGVFAGLPAAWLLYRASHAPSARVLLTAAALAFLLLRLRPLATVSQELGAIAAGKKTREAWRQAGVRVPRSGRATVSAKEAEDVLALSRYMDARLSPQETFFDFANEPGLYFLLARRMPVRFSCVPCYESPDHQEEVIARLKSERPPIAILAGGSGRDAFDGVSNRTRAPRVAAYLDAVYEPGEEVRGRRMARRRTAPGPIPTRTP
ncbi:MAG TPA: hypothetical protein VLG15_12935 [Thermoanaerobaculia bacterium]|nr:hypothetical protein [Thermoanaerobaculia bacterium]